MKITDSVLFELESNRGSSLSGSLLAKKIGVSRNAIWKAIKELQEKGYPITAVSNKGYTLLDSSDVLSWQSIKKYLPEELQSLQIDVYSEIDSTNTKAKEYVSLGENRVIVAESQTKGKGRKGRSFYSPSSSGLYLSFLFHPKFSVQESLSLTTAAAVAAAKSIEEISNVKASIKWVNDVYCSNKKVCGILTEASINVENGLLDYAITGIGFNVFDPIGGFPTEIKEIAGSILGDKNTCNINDVRSRLAAKMIVYFMGYYQTLTEKTFMEEYKARSLLLGKEIYTLTEPPIYGIAKEIDDNGHLILQKENGELLSLSSGEVSVRLQQ